MAVRTDPPSNGERFSQTCDNRRVAVEVDSASGDGVVEIPTFSVETHVSQEGVSDKNVLTEVHGPTEWRGLGVIDEIDAFDANNQERYDKATVKWQSRDSGQWSTVQYGYVRMVGPTSDPNEIRYWIGDPSDFMAAIPIGTTYGPQTTARQVFQDAAQTFKEHTIFEDVTVKGLVDESEVTGEEPQATSGPGANVLRGLQASRPGLFEDENVTKASRSFHANRDVLSDVLDWATSVIGGRWYFEADADGLVLVWEEEVIQETWVDQHVDSDGNPLRVIENDAYTEILPINAIQVNGQSDASFRGFYENAKQGHIGITGTWPTAVAQYPPLQSRTGQTLAAPVIESDTVTVHATERFAKRKLKDMMMGSPLGDIRAYGTPTIEPNDRVRVVPICEGLLSIENAQPLDYEVEKVIHTKTAEDEYKTRLEVGIFVDESLIEVNGHMADGTNDTHSEDSSSPISTAIPDNADFLSP